MKTASAIAGMLMLAAGAAQGVSSRAMLLGDYDCDDYGGDESRATYGTDLDIYPGPGAVFLHFRRDEIETATNVDAVVTHEVMGQNIRADSLNRDIVVRLSIEGGNQWPSDARSFTSDWLESYGFDQDTELTRDPRYWEPEIPDSEQFRYDDIYPGVDFWYHDDLQRREFDFLARPGSVWSNIQMRVDGVGTGVLDEDGNLVFLFDCGKLVLGRPRVYQTERGAELESLESHEGNYTGDGSLVQFDTRPLDREPAVGFDGRTARLEPELKMVPASGDTNGPPYDYYMSVFETRNAEYVEFLNSAEANATNLLGTNLFFDAHGNVWISPEMKTGRDEVFSLADSRIVYAGSRKPGERYAVTDRVPGFGGSYSNHPATGISWFGAVKYCNWLTLATGRGVDQLCYREGTNVTDWAPVTCASTNWEAGRFLGRERVAWLALRGFRLPMDNCSGTNGYGNAFGEFFKAATWFGTTNVAYGYGRTNVLAGDANFFIRSGVLKPDTLPTGFFDGTDHDGAFATRTNENVYGIHDLSGNVEEWVNDVGVTNSIRDRGIYGGSWGAPLPAMSSRRYARPDTTDTARGLRVVSSFGNDRGMLLIRIPYYTCLCGYQRVAGQEPEGEKEADKTGEEKVWKPLEVDPSLTSGDNTGISKVKPKEEGGETSTGGGGGGGGGGEAEGGGIPEEVPGGEVSAIEP